MKHEKRYSEVAILENDSVTFEKSTVTKNYIKMSKRKWKFVVVCLVTMVVVFSLILVRVLYKNNSGTMKDKDCPEFKAPSGSLPRSTDGQNWLKKDCLTTTPMCPKHFANNPTLMISMDGFRADYLIRNFTPVIGKLAACGVHAPYMRSVFPTRTFPNHYTMVTGLYPESHGIVDQRFYDIKFNEVFDLRKPSKFQPKWWAGEPIWNTAMKQGKITGTFYWAGSDTKIQDMRPNMCYKYNKSTPFEERVDEVLRWLDLPANKRPHLIHLYFDEPDSIGHITGPFSKEINETLARMDRIIGRLMDGLIKRSLENCVNIVLVADHGMEAVKCSHSVAISDYTDISKLQVWEGVFGRISGKYKITGDKIKRIPNGDSGADIIRKLDCVKYNTTKDWYVKFFEKRDLPKRLHYANNRRIDDVVMDIVDPWLVTSNRIGQQDRWRCSGGKHGYDNLYKSMHALFLAHGPAFKQNEVLEPFENIELYNLVAELIGVNPAPNNGTLGSLKHLLKNPKPLTKTFTGISPTRPRFPGLLERQKRRNLSNCICENVKNLGSTVDQLDLRLNLTKEAALSSLRHHAPYGISNSSQLNAKNLMLLQEKYLNVYSTLYKMPSYVAFRLDKKQGSTVRESSMRLNNSPSNCSRVDVRLEVEQQVNCSDYSNKTADLEPMFLHPPGLSSVNRRMDSYISTNIVPMYKSFASGTWRVAMELVEEYAEKYGRIWVKSGPIFDYNYDGLADSPEQIQTFVNSIPVPTHYFLVLSKCSDGGENCAGAQLDVMSLVIPHRKRPGNCWEHKAGFRYLADNIARVKDVEVLTKLNFFPDLLNTESVRLETFLPVGMWDRISWMDIKSCQEIKQPICPARYSSVAPPLLLISLDGFWSEYLQRNLTPTLQKLKQCGASLPFLRSIYPSLTFPNHYSISTGLYPESNGIVDNSMYDEKIGELFTLGSATSYDPRWWGGDPIWNTVEKQNKTSMTIFWPGSDVKINGNLPTVFNRFQGYMPDEYRVKKIVDYLVHGVKGKYPNLLTLYHSKVDKAGHTGGPNSQQVTEALIKVDSYLKYLMDELYKHKLHQCINIVITSDHGMSTISCNRTKMASEFLSAHAIEKTNVFSGAAGRISNKFKVDEKQKLHRINKSDRVPNKNILYNMSAPGQPFRAYPKSLLPKRLHYAYNRRIDEVNTLFDDLWQLQPTSPWCDIVGQHGWDATFSSMQAIFVGYGPSFKTNFTAKQPIENIELYNMMCHVLNITASPNNGTEGSTYNFLRNPPVLPKQNFTKKYGTFTFPSSVEDYNYTISTQPMCNCSQTMSWNTRFSLDARINMTEEQRDAARTSHLPYGLSAPEYHPAGLLFHQDYLNAYSSRLQVPLWVAFNYTNDLEPVKKGRCFRPDVRVNILNQSSCKSSINANITLHPLFPPAVSRTNDSIFDALLLTNRVAMINDFYYETWQHLTAMMFDVKSAHFIVGPIFDYNGDGKYDKNITASLSENGETYFLPTHFFLVRVLCSAGCTSPADFTLHSFILPHQSRITAYQKPLDYFNSHRARVRDVELLTGLTFFTRYNTLESVAARVLLPEPIE